MPWKEINPMDQKIQMIADWQTEQFDITDLSYKYGISRKTVYKWITRYAEEGADGLKDRSRKPNYNPNQTSKEIVDLLLNEKQKNEKRGPKKIYYQLRGRYPDIDWPAPSTIGYLFRKHNLVKPRKKRMRVEPYTEPFISCKSPNDVWSADFKGQFYTKDARVCYPLTMSDNYSRYLLKCVGLPGPRHDGARSVFEAAFREYGLPNAIRTDNGVPFASKCVGGISRLMVWLIKLGIRPERIEKGCPQQNGRHERMHRTLKVEALSSVAKTIEHQQKKFDLFRVDYNNYRPHEALDQKTPSCYYKRAIREYVEKPRKPEYDESYYVRRVRSCGEIKWHGKSYYLAEILQGEPIGLKKVTDGVMSIYYSFYLLGLLDIKNKKILRKV